MASSSVPCAIGTRATSIPAAAIARNVEVASDAGPTVATILVRVSTPDVGIGWKSAITSRVPRTEATSAQNPPTVAFVVDETH
jgi:hypothetical protein